MKSATNSPETEKGGEPWLELTEARPKLTKRKKKTKWKANHPNSTKSSKKLTKNDKTQKNQIKT